jgi:hypothetical protein
VTQADVPRPNLSLSQLRQVDSHMSKSLINRPHRRHVISIIMVIVGLVTMQLLAVIVLYEALGGWQDETKTASLHLNGR